MKRLFIALSVTFLVVLNVNSKVIAQNEVGGTVKYQKILKFEFEDRDNQRWKDMVATLPKEGRYAYVLNFTNDAAVYKQNIEEQEASTPELQRAMHIQSFMKPPQPELKKVYYDLKNNKKLEEMDFMTRVFLIESDIEEINWKLLTNKKKILDHICMGAEMTLGENTVTAWFSPKIPVSTGPDIFHGLPGLILMIEVNGEKSIVATSINSDIPEIGKKEEFSEGKKMSKKQFDKIVEEKVEEHKKNPPGRGKGFHGR